MFEGFESLKVKTSGAAINLAKGGSGPPVLLLHGYPRPMSVTGSDLVIDGGLTAQ